RLQRRELVCGCSYRVPETILRWPHGRLRNRQRPHSVPHGRAFDDSPAVDSGESFLIDWLAEQHAPMSRYYEVENAISNLVSSWKACTNWSAPQETDKALRRSVLWTVPE